VIAEAATIDILYVSFNRLEMTKARVRNATRLGKQALECG